MRSSLRRLRRVEAEGVGNIAPYLVVAGLGTVTIEGLDDSATETYVAEVGDNLLGVCYFQRLKGYDLIWQSDTGEMTICKRTP